MKKFYYLLVVVTITLLPSCGPDEVDFDSLRDGSRGEGGTTNTVVPNERGAAANHFLTSTNFTSLEIEIAYEQGSPPQSAAVSSLKSFLEAYLNKPNGIYISYTQIPYQSNFNYTVSEMLNIESNYRSKYNGGDTLTAFIFFAYGYHDFNFAGTDYLGQNLGSNSFTVLQRTLRDNTGSSFSRGNAERAVMLHFFGQLLGLVNKGTSMQINHEHSTYTNTCNNSNCVMHWENGRDELFRNSFGSSFPNMQFNCLTDLREAGGL